MFLYSDLLPLAPIDFVPVFLYQFSIYTRHSSLGFYNIHPPDDCNTVFPAAEAVAVEAKKSSSTDEHLTIHSLFIYFAFVCLPTTTRTKHKKQQHRIVDRGWQYTHGQNRRRRTT